MQRPGWRWDFHSSAGEDLAGQDLGCRSSLKKKEKKKWVPRYNDVGPPELNLIFYNIFLVLVKHQNLEKLS